MKHLAVYLGLSSCADDFPDAHGGDMVDMEEQQREPMSSAPHEPSATRMLLASRGTHEIHPPPRNRALQPQTTSPPQTPLSTIFFVSQPNVDKRPNGFAFRTQAPRPSMSISASLIIFPAVYHRNRGSCHPSRSGPQQTRMHDHALVRNVTQR